MLVKDRQATRRAHHSGQQRARIAAQVTPLITELGRTRMEVNTKVKAGFSNKLFALNVVITIPVPDTTAKADLQTSIGERVWSPIGVTGRDPSCVPCGCRSLATALDALPQQACCWLRKVIKC